MNFQDCETKCKELHKLLKSNYNYQGVDFIIDKIFPLPTDIEAKNLLINTYINKRIIETNRFIGVDVEVGLLLKKGGKFEITNYLI